MTKTVLNFSGPVTMGEIMRAYQRLEAAEQSAKSGRQTRIC